MKLAFLLSIVTVINAAYVPSEPWSTLTPSASISDATTSLSGSYALSLKTISAASATGAAKRDVANQIGDGQVQQQTAAETTAAASVVNQIGDGQVQQQTAASVVNQIGDGQVQQQTAASVVNQIGDGQVQQQTAASVVNQIGDGQVQQQTAASVVNQIGDGQVQQQTATVANQIGDGQVQATGTADAASQISDGQVQATGSPTSDDGIVKTCVKDDSLLLQLKDGVLTDSHGRIGSIVANRQFQFDGPPPQAGAIYAAGWAVVPIDYSDSKSDDTKDKREEGVKLALGKQTTFYKCLSGDFYNLYDQSLGAQCSEVEFVILEATTC